MLDSGPSAVGGEYGLGMQVHSAGEKLAGHALEEPVIGHGGSVPPFGAYLRYLPDSDIIYAALSNPLLGGHDVMKHVLAVWNTTLDELELLDGDFDHDMLLTAQVIDLLSATIRDVRTNAFYDVNQDGDLDQNDRRYWVSELAGTHFGDADLNRSVEFADFLTLASNFGNQGGWAAGDFDGDGMVEFADVLLVSTNFGESSATLANVPEPNVGVLLLTGALPFTCRRCRSSSPATA